MRDAARRTGPRAARCVPTPLRPPYRTTASDRTHRFSVVREPAASSLAEGRQRVVCGGGASGAWRRCKRCVLERVARAGRARRGPGGSRSEASGRLASPCDLSVHRCNANSR
ncbi:uncharacterized protein ACR2FA_003175 [Aphomia sociella]